MGSRGAARSAPAGARVPNRGSGKPGRGIACRLARRPGQGSPQL